MIWELVQFVGAGLAALFGVAGIRAAIDVSRDFPDEMAWRRDPNNYEDRLIGMSVDKDGGLRFKTKRVLKRRP